MQLYLAQPLHLATHYLLSNAKIIAARHIPVILASDVLTTFCFHDLFGDGFRVQVKQILFGDVAGVQYKGRTSEQNI